MSLRAVHIFFISLSILLAIGFGGWEVQRYSQSGEMLELVAGILSFGVAIGLVVYGMYFLKKVKRASLAQGKEV
jgi:flagellar biogenesis protein FliO